IIPLYAASLIRKLTEAKMQAEAANRAKSRFLATMSHELRTPLNAVTGMTEVLRHTRLDREQREMLGTVQTSARALLALINDILDLSRIEANRATAEQDDFDLNAELAEAVEILRPQAEAKGLSLTVQVDPNLPETIIGDRQRLRQILMNLLSNAVKFTETGGILLSVARESG
ncbi:MAG: sensor histidine kinase, partial [Haliea sp.]